MLLIVLAPYLEADLRRKWAPMITATDASVVFGFGASVATCSEDVAREVGRLAETKGAYVHLARDGGPTDEPEQLRLGPPHWLNLSKRAFRDVSSAKKMRDEHLGSLEASGLLSRLQCITRSLKNISCRIPVLIDAHVELLLPLAFVLAVDLVGIYARWNVSGSQVAFVYFMFACSR